MLLLLSRIAFSDGRAEFCLELVFRKTDENLYDYQTGVLQSLYEDGKLNGLPSWTNPDYISLFARIFQSGSRLPIALTTVLKNIPDQISSMD